MRILIIEDSSEWSQAIRGALADHHIYNATTYDAALELLESEEPYDLAIVSLPLGSGHEGSVRAELLDVLRIRYPLTKRIALVDQPSQTRQVSDRDDLDDVLVKNTVTAAEVRSAVHSVFAKGDPADLPLDLRVRRGELRARFLSWRDEIRRRLDWQERELAETLRTSGRITDIDANRAALATVQTRREAFELASSRTVALLARAVTSEDLAAAEQETNAMESRFEKELAEIPVSIYTSNDRIAERIELAIVELLRSAGLEVSYRGDPVLGSWFRQMRAQIRAVISTPVGGEVAKSATHAAESRLILSQDAAVTATMMQNLGPVIGALQPTKDAVIRIGALLIVKVDWVVTVFQLTAVQQLELDHRPLLATSPKEIIASLQLAQSTTGSDGNINSQADMKLDH
jgi:DNA-binding response OmpR family regulator